jgi:hypothetical protein
MRYSNRSMKVALLLCFCSVVFAQTPPVQTQTLEPQDLQLSRTRQNVAPRRDSNWPPAGPTPRTADGHPDLSGNWEPNAIRENVDMIGAGVDVPLLPGPKGPVRETPGIAKQG